MRSEYKYLLMSIFWLLAAYGSAQETNQQTNQQTNQPTTQANIVVAGLAVSEKGDPIESGNIFLLNPKDSSLIRGNFFLDGALNIIAPRPHTKVLLLLTSLGYQDTYKLLELPSSGATWQIGEIIVAKRGEMLPEVTVVEYVPMFEMKADVLNVNVEQSALANSTSLTDMLSKLPSVVMINGELTIASKGTPIIYLDRQRLRNNEWNSIATSQIKSIQVIENPSARYEADGRVVIQVITKSNTVGGIRGSLKVQENRSRRDLFQASVNLNSKFRKWAYNASYEYAIGYSKWVDEAIEFRLPADKIFADYQSASKRKKNGEQLYQAGIQYDLGDKDFLSIKYNGRNTNIENDLASSTYRIVDQEVIWTNANIQGGEKISYNSVNVNYEKSLDSLGSHLFFGFLYSAHQAEKYDEILEEHVTDQNVLLGINGGNSINVLSPAIDYEYRNDNNLSFQSGLKFSAVQTDGYVEARRRLFNELDFQPVPSLTNNFEYNEMIFSAYAQLNKSFGNWKTDLGIRMERSQLQGFSGMELRTVIDTSFLNVFPNLNVKYSINDNNSLAFNFRSSITRPVFSELDPFITYASEFVAFQGNPGVRNAITHQLSTVYQFKKTQFELSYFKIINHINRSQIFNEEESSVIFISENFAALDGLSFIINQPFSYKFWQSYTTARLNYDTQSPQLGDPFNDPILYLYLYTNHTFKLPANLKLELSGLHRTKYDDGVKQFDAFSNIGMALLGSLYKKKIDYRFSIDDIFNSMVITNSFDINAIQSDGTWRYSTRWFRLSLSYNFGKLKTSSYKNDDVNKEQTNRIGF